VVIVYVPSTSSSVHTALTASRSGGVCAPARMEPSAIVKQVACAAAISSSGLVFPSGSPKREAAVTGSATNAPLAPDTAPSPSAIVPSQTTLADLLIAVISAALRGGERPAPIEALDPSAGRNRALTPGVRGT